MCPELAAGAAVLANSLMTAVSGILIIRPFLGRSNAYDWPVKEAPAVMWIGPVILGGVGIVFGIIPDWVGRWLVEPAVHSFHSTTKAVHLALFHGINEPLFLSILTLTLGIAFYFGKMWIYRWVTAATEKMPFSASHVYEACVKGIAGLGKFELGLIQNGSLHRYFFIVAGTFVLVTGYSYLGHGPDFPEISTPFLAWREWILLAVILAAVMTVIITRVILLAICALGVIGAGLAIIFLSFGAPDLALTQLLVETLTVVIVSMILLRLPALAPQPKKVSGKRLLDALLAVGTGVLVTTLLLAVLSTELDRSVTAFFEQKSYLAAHGKNIVNVILVDFRSMDTLGEIIVVAAAGLAGYALIQKRGRP